MLKAEKRNYAKLFTLELYACEFCELCVQVCPTDAIIMLRTFDLATSDRRELLLDKDRLHALGRQFPASWATGNGLRAMQAPPARGKGEHARAAAAKDPAEGGGSDDRRGARADRARHPRPRREPGRRTGAEPLPLRALARRRPGGHCGTLPPAPRRVPGRRPGAP